MAEKKTNGRAETAEAGAEARTIVHGQFIRDFSFENFMAQTKQWSIQDLKHEVSIQVHISKEAENRYVVSIKAGIDAKSKDKPAYLIELDYCGLFTVENMPENRLRAFLAVQCPHYMFPFVRRIVSDITRDGGFPPFNMDLIDFAANAQRQNRPASD
ncbi:MAG: protein-export chaperone SecB [Rhodobacteraceae bacterium]|nr:protein-export chaperone SecB [Paracoccaceae bacterium]